MGAALNENIKQLRISHGLNQVAFAKLLGVSKQCVSNWENDNVQPSIEMLVRLADIFHVSADHLLGREGAEMLDVSKLTPMQRGHISLLIHDLAENNGKLH